MSGYGFTPLPPGPRVVERPQARLDRRLPGMVFGRLELVYKLDQPVHIGAGRKVVVNGGLVRATVRSRSTAVVPGSSWKGAVRARYEAITRSCAHRAPKRQYKITSQNFDGFTVELDRNTERLAVFKPCRTRAGDAAPIVCPACALFGLMNRRARVTFADLVADQEPVLESIAQQYSPRLHHVGEFRVDRQQRQLTVYELHGRKFHVEHGPDPVGKLMQVEVIPAGAIISGTLRLHNVDPAELGGVLVALGFSSAPSFVKIGAGKNLDFGRIRPMQISGALKIGTDADLQTILARSEAAFAESADRWQAGEAKLRELHKGTTDGDAR